MHLLDSSTPAKKIIGVENYNKRLEILSQWRVDDFSFFDCLIIIVIKKGWKCKAWERAISQGLLQLQAWVSSNGVLKDCMIKVYLSYRILMKY